MAGTLTDTSSAPSLTNRPDKPVSWPSRLLWLLVTGIALAAYFSAKLDISALADFPAQAWKYLLLMFAPPNWGKLGEAFTAMVLSVQMAWIGTLLGIAVSFPLSFFAAAPLAPRWISWPLRGVFAVLRAVPEVVTAILILSVTGLTPFTGALALAVGSIGNLGKWGYETFEAVDRGPLEAVRSTGSGAVGLMRWGIWPSASAELLSLWLYRFEINVRASAILGLIGAGGIGKMLSDNVQFRNWDAVGMLLLVVIVVTMIIDQLSGAVRHRLIHGRWAVPFSTARRRPRSSKLPVEVPA